MSTVLVPPGLSLPHWVTRLEFVGLILVLLKIAVQIALLMLQLGLELGL